MDVEAYAILPNLKPTWKQWATQPQVLESGLLVAGTLLPERALDLTVRIMNPTGRDIKLRKGIQCMLEEVTLIESESRGFNTSGCASVTEVLRRPEQDEAEVILAPLWSDIA